MVEYQEAKSWEDVVFLDSAGNFINQIYLPHILGSASQKKGLRNEIYQLFYDQHNLKYTMGADYETGAGIVRRPAFQDALCPFYIFVPIDAFIEELLLGGKEEANHYAKSIIEETNKHLIPLHSFRELYANHFSKLDQRNDAHENPGGLERIVYLVGDAQDVPRHVQPSTENGDRIIYKDISGEESAYSKNEDIRKANESLNQELGELEKKLDEFLKKN